MYVRYDQTVTYIVSYEIYTYNADVYILNSYEYLNVLNNRIFLCC